MFTDQVNSRIEADYLNADYAGKLVNNKERNWIFNLILDYEKFRGESRCWIMNYSFLSLLEETTNHPNDRDRSCTRGDPPRVVPC